MELVARAFVVLLLALRHNAQVSLLARARRRFELLRERRDLRLQPLARGGLIEEPLLERSCALLGVRLVVLEREEGALQARQRDVRRHRERGHEGGSGRGFAGGDSRHRRASGARHPI